MFSDNLSSSLLRLCGGISYETAAERCGMSARYLGSIIRRRATPSVASLEKLCDGFGVTPNDLLLAAGPGREPPA